MKTGLLPQHTHPAPLPSRWSRNVNRSSSSSLRQGRLLARGSTRPPAAAASQSTTRSKPRRTSPLLRQCWKRLYSHFSLSPGSASESSALRSLPWGSLQTGSAADPGSPTELHAPGGAQRQPPVGAGSSWRKGPTPSIPRTPAGQEPPGAGTWPSSARLPVSTEGWAPGLAGPERTRMGCQAAAQQVPAQAPTSTSSPQPLAPVAKHCPSTSPRSAQGTRSNAVPWRSHALQPLASRAMSGRPLVPAGTLGNVPAPFGAGRQPKLRAALGQGQHANAGVTSEERRVVF